MEASVTEFLIKTKRSFDEIETVIAEALERQGLAVQHTFSLRSAVGLSAADVSDTVSDQQGTDTAGSPEYSVLMLHEVGAARRPLGLFTLYQRGGRTVASLVLTMRERGPLRSAGAISVGADRDLVAELTSALVSSGLDFCLGHPHGDRCLSAEELVEIAALAPWLVQDPVCGAWVERGDTAAHIEYGGEIYYACCPTCAMKLEADPARYARG